MSLTLPLKGIYIITQTFEKHKQRAIDNGWCWKPGADCKTYYYPGIDYGCPKGTKIFASHSGKCNVRYDNSGYGYHVRLSDGAIMTVYGHMSEIKVKDGATVKQGDLLGLSGGVVDDPGAGNTTGAHLHWELRLNNIPSDPALYLGDSDPQNNDTDIDIQEGAVIALKSEWEYVNLRQEPTTASADMGDLLPGVEAKVIERKGKWVKILVPAWVHVDYIQIMR